MALNILKPILLKDGFSIDPLYAQNSQLSQENKYTLPSLEPDVSLDKRQSVYYSFEYVLKRLLDNDKFIDNYLKKSRNQIDYVSQDRLSNSIKIDENGIDTLSSTVIYNQYFIDHIEKYHTNSSVYKLSSVAENFIKNDMSNFNESAASSVFLKKSSDGNSLTNDIVVDVEFSEDVRKPMNYVTINVCNKMTNWKFKSSIDVDLDAQAEIPELTSTTYIHKRWLSGMKELYIHIPTTFTVYNENLSADNDDYWKGENIENNFTIIQVKINGRHFQWKNIYQAYICGQSLPLQIHNKGSYPYFSDVILPSLLKTVCVQPNSSSTNTNCIYDPEQQTYTLYFTCYGTDEQAIRIFGD